MTTFVPLAPDAEGTASAVAAGDWLLQIITKHDPARTQEYYVQFVSQFELDEDTGEQRIRDHMKLFELLLSQHVLVFDYVARARQQQQQQEQQPGGGGSSGGAAGDKKDSNAPATEAGRKSYAEVLREVEDFFSLLTAMIVLRMPDPKNADRAARTLCDVYRSSTEMPEFRLRLDWMQDWNLAPSSKREVFFILANELKKLGKTEEAYSYLKRHVQLFQGEKEETLANKATVSASAELVEDSIRLPDVMVFDNLVELHAVQYLRHTAHAQLLELLHIFVNKGPVELEAFKQLHPQLFEERSLNYAQCLLKIRLLAIASLAGKGKKEISFKSIAEALRVDEAAAEEVAVQAIGQGTIDAKIDQMGKVLHVRSAMQREFGRPQWEELLERLECWQDGVRALLGCMKSVKQQVNLSNQNAAAALPAASSSFPPTAPAVPAAAPQAAEAML